MPLAAGMYYSRFNGGVSSKKPVVLIHGAGHSHLIWPASMRRLSGRIVLALDLPGHGRSIGVALQSVEAICAVLVEFLAELGLYQAVIVGHALGGAVALQMGLDYPQHTSALGIISSGASFDVSADLLHYLSGVNTHDAAMQFIQKRAFAASSSQTLVRRGMVALSAVRPSVVCADWTACAQFDLRKRLGEIQAPAYIACGQEDQLASPGGSRFLAVELPQARLDLLPGAGHMLPIEQPEALTKGLREFLNELDRFEENIPLNWTVHKSVGNGHSNQTKLNY
jgi:pimeloyl-ACP methyl ester carboxylesterase